MSDENLNDSVPVLFQDEHLVVVEKPAKMIIHPYKRFHHEKRNLMATVRDQIGQYVYPIHRLDRPVSGAIVFGLNKDVTKKIKDHWHDPETLKEYIALVRGRIEEDGQFNFRLRDDRYKKPAMTRYWVLHCFADTTLVKVKIETGRKHQIRRHFSRRMHHLLGDVRYGHRDMNEEYRDKYGLDRIFLHAFHLKFTHPIENNIIDIFSPLPLPLKTILHDKGLSSTEELLDFCNG